MSKQFNPGRTIVMPRASRIRREPPAKAVERFWQKREWERRFAIAGVILFAIALALIWVGIGYITADHPGPPLEIHLQARPE